MGGSNNQEHIKIKTNRQLKRGAGNAREPENWVEKDKAEQSSLIYRVLLGKPTYLWNLVPQWKMDRTCYSSVYRVLLGEHAGANNTRVAKSKW